MRRLLPVFLLFAVAACGSDASPTATTSSAPYSQVDLVVGTGATAVAGKSCSVNYGLWLYDSSKTDGKGTLVQQSTSPFAFVLGAGGVIPGFTQGVTGMKVGGQRRLIIPPELAYGSAGTSGIPPNATIVYDITLLSVV
ncbi:MAG TPA: FKBP-type peptidyl-prolyl cis-trans isomerase [Vicinamibacterales bacterium]|jgi:FKBP-type peptidyl-prolyl cis-trans isomerase FkpA